jgi:hypothetical protein
LEEAAFGGEGAGRGWLDGFERWTWGVGWVRLWW